MARPSKCRRVCSMPGVTEFVPQGKNPDAVVMRIDEYETIRLLDYEGMTQEQCAAQMGVARATVSIIYDSARKKIADTIVNGKRLVIEGGNIAICEYAGDCCGNCGKQECSACVRRKCCMQDKEGQT